MSKKRRKRRPRAAAGPAAPKPAAAKPAPAKTRPPASRRRADPDERPPAPWGSFPLVELVVLVSLVMLVAGFFAGGTRGTLLLGTGLVLGSLAGLELSIREHFGGYRSHTLLLAGFAAIVVLAGLYFALPSDLVPVAPFAAGIAVFALAAWVLTRTFRQRSGRAFKLR